MAKKPAPKAKAMSKGKHMMPNMPPKDIPKGKMADKKCK